MDRVKEIIDSWYNGNRTQFYNQVRQYGESNFWLKLMYNQYLLINLQDAITMAQSIALRNDK